MVMVMVMMMMKVVCLRVSLISNSQFLSKEFLIYFNHLANQPKVRPLK